MEIFYSKRISDLLKNDLQIDLNTIIYGNEKINLNSKQMLKTLKIFLEQCLNKDLYIRKDIDFLIKSFDEIMDKFEIEKNFRIKRDIKFEYNLEIMTFLKDENDRITGVQDFNYLNDEREPNIIINIPEVQEKLKLSKNLHSTQMNEINKDNILNQKKIIEILSKEK